MRGVTREFKNVPKLLLIIITEARERMENGRKVRKIK